MSRNQLIEEVLKCAKATACDMDHETEMPIVVEGCSTFPSTLYVGPSSNGLVCQRSFLLDQTTFYVGLAEPVDASEAPRKVYI